MSNHDFERRLGLLLRDTATDIESQADVAPRVRQRLSANGGGLGSRQWLAAASMVAIVALLVGTFVWFKSGQLGSHPVDSSQIVLHLDAAYADSTMTMLEYHITSPRNDVGNIHMEYSPFFPVLTSAIGTPLPEVSGGCTTPRPFSTSQCTRFIPLPLDELGARQTLTLTVTRMMVNEIPLQPIRNPPTLAVTSIVKGLWRASIEVTPIAGTSVPFTGVAQTHGGISIQPLRLDASPHGVRIVIHMGGLTPGSQESPSFTTSAYQPANGDSSGDTPTPTSGATSLGQATLTTPTGPPLLPDNVVNLDSAGKPVRGPNTIPNFDSAGKPLQSPYTIPASGVLDIELVYIQPPHGSVTLTFDHISLGTAGSPLHTITGPWAFSLTIGG